MRCLTDDNLVNVEMTPRNRPKAPCDRCGRIFCSRKLVLGLCFWCRKTNPIKSPQKFKE